MNEQKEPTLWEIWKIVTANKVTLTNHLRHHEIWFKCVIAPIGVGVALNLLILVGLLIKGYLGG